MKAAFPDTHLVMDSLCIVDEEVANLPEMQPYLLLAKSTLSVYAIVIMIVTQQIK